MFTGRPFFDNISIHAPRVGRDRRNEGGDACAKDFNPRAPCGARRTVTFEIACGSVFQSTRPVWGATCLRHRVYAARKISIHAPRVGRDALSTDAPRARAEFQSTRPVWGATGLPGRAGRRSGISIHAPRVGRDAYWDRLTRALAISIHAPRVGRDCPPAERPGRR